MIDNISRKSTVYLLDAVLLLSSFDINLEIMMVKKRKKKNLEIMIGLKIYVTHVFNICNPLKQFCGL